MVKWAWDDLNHEGLYGVSYYLRDELPKRLPHKMVCLSDEYSLHWQIQVHSATEKGVQVTHEQFSEKTYFTKGEQVIAHQQKTIDYIQSKYTFTVLEKFYNVTLYEITGDKTESDLK